VKGTKAMSKEPINVEEVIGVLMEPGDTKDVKKFISELDEAYNKFIAKHYTRFNVSMVAKNGKAALNFVGFRPEEKEETKRRLEMEEEKRKKAEEVELMEYLRLKKKYQNKEG
jgi:hypothetical protein